MTTILAALWQSGALPFALGLLLGALILNDALSPARERDESGSFLGAVGLFVAWAGFGFLFVSILAGRVS